MAIPSTWDAPIPCDINFVLGTTQVVVRASRISVSDRQSNALGPALAVAELRDAELLGTFRDQGSGFQLEPDPAEWRFVLIDSIGRFVPAAEMNLGINDGVAFFGWYSEREDRVDPKPLMVGVGRQRDDAIEFVGPCGREWNRALARAAAAEDRIVDVQFLERVRDDADLAMKVMDIADPPDD